MRTLLLILVLTMLLPRSLWAGGGHGLGCTSAVPAAATLSLSTPTLAAHEGDAHAGHHMSAVVSADLDADAQATPTGDLDHCDHCADCGLHAPALHLNAFLAPTAPLPASLQCFALTAYLAPTINRLDRPPALA